MSRDAADVVLEVAQAVQRLDPPGVKDPENLAHAAACYALGVRMRNSPVGAGGITVWRTAWPWASHVFRPHKARRDDLLHAAALLVAAAQALE